jgi:SAM-dependent methyltransferase
MYDYVIGGTHNFEIDRTTADEVVRLVPSIRLAGIHNRSFLRVAAARWAQSGLSRVLDLGSGLPTQGHFNETMPAAQILFTDHDALTVEYAREILQGNPRYEYLELDVTDGPALVSAVRRTFGDDRQLGVGLIGVSYFLTDDQLKELLRTLYSLCDPGSVLAISFVPRSEAWADLVNVYERLVKTNVYVRSPEEVSALLSPWQLVDYGTVQQFLHEDSPNGEAPQQDELQVYGLFATIP